MHNLGYNYRHQSVQTMHKVLALVIEYGLTQIPNISKKNCIESTGTIRLLVYIRFGTLARTLQNFFITIYDYVWLKWNRDYDIYVKQLMNIAMVSTRNLQLNKQV